MYCTNPECPDVLSSGRPGEYVDGVESCPACGARLTELAVPATDDAAVDEPFEPVFETGNPAEVPIIKSLLGSAEIPYLVDGDTGWDALRGGLTPFRFSHQGPRIVFSVPPERAEEARALLEEVEEAVLEEVPENALPPPGCDGGCPGSC